MNSSSFKYCSAKNHKNPNNSTPIAEQSNLRSSKSITEQFAESLKKCKTTKKTTSGKADVQYLLPVDGYTSRFQYNGFLRKSHWVYYDNSQNQRPTPSGPETEEQSNYRTLRKRKFCILVGFAGGNYHGMQFQYHQNSNTIERELFHAMVRNRWILPEHLEKMWLLGFEHGSRTDTGVSAARMNVSMTLREFSKLKFIPTKKNHHTHFLCFLFFCWSIAAVDVNIDALNADLPSDIRVFGMRQTIPSFSARFNCSARTIRCQQLPSLITTTNPRWEIIVHQPIDCSGSTMC